MSQSCESWARLGIKWRACPFASIPMEYEGENQRRLRSCDDMRTFAKPPPQHNRENTHTNAWSWAKNKYKPNPYHMNISENVNTQILRNKMKFRNIEKQASQLVTVYVNVDVLQRTITNTMHVCMSACHQWTLESTQPCNTTEGWAVSLMTKINQFRRKNWLPNCAPALKC